MFAVKNIKAFVQSIIRAKRVIRANKANHFALMAINHMDSKIKVVPPQK